MTCWFVIRSGPLLPAVAALLLLSFEASGQAPQIVLEDEPQRVAGSSVNGQVLNGNRAGAGHWPSTFTFRTTERNCTATAVGRQVILVAAHCVGDGQELDMPINSLLSVEAKLYCSHHTSYKFDVSADYALCALSKPLKDPPIGFERVASTEDHTALGATLLIIGYGCTTTEGDPDYGNLYLGYAQVTTSSFGRHYISSAGGASVCTGDSGGGVYWVKDPAQITKDRVLLGVNSRGDFGKQLSWFSATGVSSFVDWAESWIAKIKEEKQLVVSICGLGQVSDHCRPQP